MASSQPSTTHTGGCYPVTLYAKWGKNSSQHLAISIQPSQQQEQPQRQTQPGHRHQKYRGSIEGEKKLSNWNPQQNSPPPVLRSNQKPRIKRSLIRLEYAWNGQKGR